MGCNVGGVDRISAHRCRSGAGDPGRDPHDRVWGWIGVVPLATGLLGRCPAYTLFGIKTCKSAEV